MRKKRVWRYYCDHCKKAGCQSGAMAKHERHCCGNPERVCRMCAFDQGEPNEQKPMAELVAAYELGLDELRKVSGGCPSCMLAALINWRKANPGEAEQWDDQFDFKKEAKEWFANHTDPDDLLY